MIKYKNVSKHFGDIKALQDVDLEIKEGEFVFVVGPSGSGKTTLLRLLLAEYQPTSGTVEFDGIDISTLKRREIPYLRQKIGVVFQDFKLLPERTIKENIEVALAVKKVDKTKWHKRVKKVLETVGIIDRANLFPSQLSGGELQRASLARSLVVSPKVIFADEPTGNLDWDTAESILKLLKDINTAGRTVIVASHHQKIINEYNERVVTLKKGKLVKDTKKEGQDAS